MSAELMAEITRLTAELQKISRIWDIAHEFQERHIARMEEENRGQRAEISELKAQRDCDREAVANYERMVGDHQGRAAAEVERLEMELEKQAATLEEELDRWRVTHADDEPSWKHAAWNRGKERDQARAEVEQLTGERDREVKYHADTMASLLKVNATLQKEQERLSLAEKLAKAAESYSAIHATIRTTAHAVPGVLSDGTWTAGCNAGADLRDALDAFISSGRGEGVTEARVEPPGETRRILNALGEWAQEMWDSEVANRPMTNIYREMLDTTWRRVLVKVNGFVEELEARQEMSVKPPAQPPKDPGEVPMESSLEMAEEIARLKVGYEAERYAAKQWMDDCRKAEASLTSLEEENARLHGVNTGLVDDFNRMLQANSRVAEENAKLRAFRDAAERDIRHRHNHWIHEHKCYTCCEPWPCPPIAALDATEGK